METPGPDGFLLQPDDPLRVAHRRIDDYLLNQELLSTGGSEDRTAWRKVPKKELGEQIAAVLLRLRWLYLHDAELDKAHESRTRLGPALRGLYTIKAPYTEPQLRRLLDLTAPLLGRIGSGPTARRSWCMNISSRTASPQNCAHRSGRSSKT
jgi:hypothetical protein